MAALPLPEILVQPAVPTDIAATGATVGGDVGGALATGADIGAGAAGALSGVAGIAAASGGIGPLAVVDALTGGAFTGDFTTLPLAQTNPTALVNMWPQIQASLADFPSVANRYGNLTQAQVAQQLGLNPAQWQTPAGGGVSGATGPLAAISAPGAGGLSETALGALEASPGAAAMAEIGTPAPGVLDPFANAPEAVPGEAPANLTAFGQPGEDIFSLAQTPDLGTPGTGVGALTTGTGIATPQPMDIPATISASGAPAAATTTAPAAAATPAAAAPTAGTAAGAAGPSFGSVLRTAGELAPLGALGITLARGQPSLPPAMQQALNNLGPAQNLATTQLSAAAANQITPAQAAQIAQYKTNATNELYQLYAREGRDPTNDTDYLQGLAQIDANALAIQQQFIDAMIKNGLAAQGAVDSTLQAAATLQVQQDEAFQQSISSAMQSFGLVTAINTIGSSRTPAAA